jgi:hypothetical protein
MTAPLNGIMSSTGNTLPLFNVEKHQSVESVKKSLIKQAKEIQSVEMKKLLIQQAIFKHMVTQKTTIDTLKQEL